MVAAARALTLATAALALGLTFDDADVQDDERPIHERIDLPSIAACGGCHRDEFDEWSRSLHARAWTNANVRSATQGFEKKSCRPCHSPEPVLTSGLDRAPLFRDFNQADGVHCLSCHGLADGVAASRTIEDAPCRPRFDPRLRRADLCYPCHQPTHGAFDEYVRSDAFELGLTCADCHMQIRASGIGHDHGPNGGLNADFVRRAVHWTAELDGDDVLVTVRNRAGHRFPGEIPSRSFLIETTFPGEAPQRTTLRKPHKREARDDDRLEPDEERVFRFRPADQHEQPDRDGTGARVRLLFRPLPLLPLDECFVLGAVTLERD